jgi:rhodanese-related sulfurtransferase
VEAHEQQAERVDSDRARELVASDEVIVIDIRDPDEFAEVHIPGARPAPDSDPESLAAELEGETVLVVCDEGERSASFAAELRGRGIAADSLDGGMKRWARERLPTQPSGDPRKEPEGPPKLPGAGTVS